MKIRRILHRIGVILGVLAGLQTAAGANQPTVAITAIVEHSDLDTVRDGVRDALADAGYTIGKNLEFLFETADADPAKATAIAQRFAAARPDVVVAISAPAAAAIVREINDLPIVITAMTQESANEILATRRRTRHIAGRVEATPYAEQLTIIAEIAPQTSQVLVPYNQSDPDSQAIAQALDKIAEPMPFTLGLVPATDADILSGLREQATNNTAIFLPDDPAVDLPVEEIAAFTAESGLLLVAGDAEAVARGAIASITHDPYGLGWQAGEAVIRILKGAWPHDVAIRPAQATYLILNKKAAENSGIELQPALLERAGIVHE